MRWSGRNKEERRDKRGSAGSGEAQVLDGTKADVIAPFRTERKTEWMERKLLSLLHG